jgi:ABC-2 type transport system permease protein
MPSLWVQLTSLLYIELTNWRWTWRSMVITGTLAPLLSILGLGVFAHDSGPNALAYVLTGNLVISLMFGNMGAIQSHITFLRFRGGLDYFATLPIYRFSLILAMLLAFLLISMPSLMVTLLVGQWFLGIALHPHPLVMVVIPLCALPLAGIGAWIGISARAPEEANAFHLVVTLVLAGMGPVLVPPERLPGFLLALGSLSPATYAASALRQALLGPVTPRMLLDLAVLLGLSIVLIWFTSQKMDWRQAES